MDCQVRKYCGDFEDVAEFTRRIWIPQYGGKTWFPLWEAPFLRWQLGPHSEAFCPAAYHGSKLVGTAFSFPHSLQIGPSIHPITLCSWFNVDPDHGRLALPLMEQLRRCEEERGIALSIGVVMGDQTSPAYRFWTKYAQTFPQKLRFLFSTSLWVKLLAPQRIARASVKAWQRLASSTLADPLLRLAPPRNDPRVRDYRAGDLEQCARILEKATAGFDWALVWSEKQLANQLNSSPASGTLVFESDACIQGMVSYHFLTLHGREPVRAALIDLWAADDLTSAQQVRLLSHLCNDLRERGVHLVLALRSALIPAGVLIRNLFLPDPAQIHFAAFAIRRDISLSPPRTWSLLIR